MFGFGSIILIYTMFPEFGEVLKNLKPFFFVCGFLGSTSDI